MKSSPHVLRTNLKLRVAYFFIVVATFTFQVICLFTPKKAILKQLFLLMCLWFLELATASAAATKRGRKMESCPRLLWKLPRSVHKNRTKLRNPNCTLALEYKNIFNMTPLPII